MTKNPKYRNLPEADRLYHFLLDTCSPSMSSVASKPLSLSCLTWFKASSLLSPATYGLANGLANPLGRKGREFVMIELKNDIQKIILNLILQTTRFLVFNAWLKCMF